MKDKLTVGELVYRISGDMDNLKTELKKAETEISKLKDSMERSEKTSTKLAKGFTAVKTAVVGFVSGALVRGIWSMAQAGAQLESLRSSFNNLTGQLGLSSDEVLKSLKDLSGGTISQKDIILSANRAMVLGVAKDMDEFSTLMQTARLRARDMGLTTTQAFDNIVTGIGRGSPLILDNLGFVVSATQATEEYAKQLGKSVEELTEQEKKEAIKASILRQGNEEIERAGKITANYSDRLAQASTFVTDLKDNIGLALLPAMASLIGVTLDSSEGLLDSTKKINDLGETFYRVGQGIIVVAKGIENGFRLVVLGIQNMARFWFKTIKGVLVVAEKTADLLKIDQEVISNGIDVVTRAINDLDQKMDKNGDSIENNAETILNSMKEAFDPKNYQGLTDQQLAALKAMADGTDEAGDAAKDASDKVKDLQAKLLDLKRTASDTAKDLQDKLSESFSNFGDSLKGNVEETVSGLAQIVIGAQDRIKELKDQLKNTDDSDQRSQLKDEIKEQEKILSAREDFEQRQADRITAIRTKLEEVGIDTAKAGLDNLLNIRSLEQEIEEERRIASLDEFTRFEEEQSKKLLLLTDNFVTEQTLLQTKIETQKQYEADLTSFLLSEESKRLENTESWAEQTISKYKEVADSLRGLLSTEAQIKSLKLSTSPVATSPVGDVGAPNQNVTNNTKNTNISAPVTINGQTPQNLSASEISAILGFELNKFIRS